MLKGTLEIAIYEPPAPPDALQADSAVVAYFAPQLGRRALSRYVVGSAGALVSLVLHALLITSLTWNGRDARVSLPRPPALRALGSRVEEDEEFTMELVAVENASPLSDEPDEQAFASPALASVGVEAALADVSTVSVPERQSAQTNLSEADAAAQTALTGRYLGQIDARIERAWRRPRTPVVEGVFSCRARIEQDVLGEVKEITLEHCNGDARWQESLVHAIQLASPLPAPPDPKVFARVVHMDFRAESYSAQAQQDAYEPMSGP